MSELMSLEALTALVTLTGMEIVLGIDNIIFISIMVGRLPQEKQAKARSLGIFLALFMRLLLLFSITWVMGLTEPLFSVMDKTVSGRDLILLLGGLFLMGKATFEIHHKVEDLEEVDGSGVKNQIKAQMGWTLVQIVILDIVFSLDSVITAVGMAQQISIMVIAMVLSMVVMLVSAGGISGFVDRHPTVKILALSFLLLIGVMLVVEGTGNHVSKGYIYFAMFFSLAVEMLNLRYRTKRARFGIVTR
ncbi:MAG: TerC family protein [Bdellovibrionaceae bacterium]|nr:TerC family protein [Bdellovibrionales bacterium]MCB9085034.1 TerC family protein [Pseudobdellovibrionaceae bacterium]